jgi:phospholipase D3/4
MQPSVRQDVFDPSSLIERTVPAWSSLVPSKQRTANPLDRPEFRTKYDWHNPLQLELDSGSGTMFITGAPQEVCIGERTFDGDALVNTILDAESSVCICVMDFAPVSLYWGTCDDTKHKYKVGDRVATPVWWPALYDAVLHVVTTNARAARLLISEWAHTSEFITPRLQALQAAANAGAAKHTMQAGRLEIRRFRVSGWQSTEAHSGSQAHEKASRPRAYPGHSRVNHTKYIVTDRRANIGTSNMT